MIWAVLIAFVASLAVGPILLPVLRRLKFGQNVYELAPKTHQKKQGTPTMGGWMICIVGVAVAAAMHQGGWRIQTDMMLAAILLSVGNLCVGFADDMTKIRRKNNKGLSEKQKLVFQIALGLAFAYYCFAHPHIGSSIIVPFLNVEWNLGWFYIPAAAFVIVATANSANLLDGLDGLLGSVSLVDFATFGLLALFAANAAQGEAQGNLLNVAVLCCAMAGACMGFLRFNTYPAHMIMGDTGSMFIGGAMVAVALMLRLPLLLVLICFCMLISSLSVILQRLYFKRTHGKRIFKSSPLHHHFELLGVPESKIVAMYTIVTVLLCLLSLLGVSG
ncbi:MAG: phospho-N-acetylmuramoyl-pentapeptide-transferase [Clostridia bacterium]|nr:phospho-N-acetylmuramoyl-pentapeptide-transferase [Clostridia bacterium]